MLQNKPVYVTDLEAAYGAPSQAGFGSAVFMMAGMTALTGEQISGLLTILGLTLIVGFVDSMPPGARLPSIPLLDGLGADEGRRVVQARLVLNFPHKPDCHHRLRAAGNDRYAHGHDDDWAV